MYMTLLSCAVSCCAACSEPRVLRPKPAAPSEPPMPLLNRHERSTRPEGGHPAIHGLVGRQMGGEQATAVQQGAVTHGPAGGVGGGGAQAGGGGGGGSKKKKKTFKA